MGDFLIMIDIGIFIINGVECVIVFQFVWFLSVYFSGKVDKNGKKGFIVIVILNCGVWLEYEIDVKDVVYVCIDCICKLLVMVFLCVFGFGFD